MSAIYDKGREEVEPASDEEDLEAMLREHRRQGVIYTAPIWRRAEENQRFVHEQQWTDGEILAHRENPQVPQLVMNEIGVILDTFSGRQMMQRFERSYIPRSPDSQAQAEIMTAIDKALMQAVDAEQVESQFFKDGPGIQGVSCIRWRYDTLEDQRGLLIPEDIPIQQMMWDPEARKINLADRNWHRYGEWLSKREVKERWPDRWKEVESKAGSNQWAEMTPGVSVRTPWSNIDRTPGTTYDGRTLAWWDKRSSMLFVEYEQWREVTYRYNVAIPAPGFTYADAMANPEQELLLTSEMAADEMQQVKAMQEEKGDPIPSHQIVKFPKMTYRHAWIIGDEIMETGEIPVGRFTFLFLASDRYIQPGKVDWKGLVDKLKDAQRWVNLLISSLARQLTINPKGLFIYERGLFANRRSAMNEFAAPGGAIEVPRGKLQGNDPYRFVQAGSSPFSQMVESLLGLYRDAIPRIAGFNPGALGQLGSDLRRISGTVVSQVQDAAMTANASKFDAFRAYRRELGRLIMAFCRVFWGNRLEELAEIVGSDLAYEPVDPMAPPDPTTGMPPPPQLRLTPEMFEDSFWKSIAIEDVTPTGDLLEQVWEGLVQHGALQVLLSPQPDTGQPIMSSEDIAEMLPGIPAVQREKIKARIQRQILEMQQQKAMEAQMQSQQQGQPPAQQQG